ncbi:hypothetical protein F7725_023234, partial [Dissostichus mawsoni]
RACNFGGNNTDSRVVTAKVSNVRVGCVRRGSHCAVQTVGENRTHSPRVADGWRYNQPSQDGRYIHGSESRAAPRESRSLRRTAAADNVLHESFCGLGLLFITINLGSPYPKKHLRRAHSPRRDIDIGNTAPLKTSMTVKTKAVMETRCRVDPAADPPAVRRGKGDPRFGCIHRGTQREKDRETTRDRPSSSSSLSSPLPHPEKEVRTDVREVLTD